MVEQLFIQKPNIYRFSLIFSLFSRVCCFLSQHFTPQTAKQIIEPIWRSGANLPRKVTAKQIGADLEQMSQSGANEPIYAVMVWVC
jgi:hypothetical protein